MQKLRLVIQTKKRKYKEKKEPGEKDIRDDEISGNAQEEDSTHDEYDQDISISFGDDDEDNTTSQDDDLENWIGIHKKHEGS